MTSDYAGLLRALLPELSLVIGALLVLGCDLTLGRRRPYEERMRLAVFVGGIGLLFAVFHAARAPLAGPVFQGVIVIDGLARMTRLGVFALALLALFSTPATARTRYPAEYVAMMLFAVTGFSLMAVAQQLLVTFLAIELASLALYVLAGFDKTRSESAEAGLKYFLFGGMSAAFLLFGFSLLYGLTGSIELPRIAFALHGGTGGPLLVVAVVMVLVAFGFKAAAAPFHLWAPDVYEGAPPASAAFIASGSKLAGVVVFSRLLWTGFRGDASAAAPSWQAVVFILSIASLVLGNVAALAQTNVRRLLAYSAIGHAGVMLLAVMSAGTAGMGPVVYYGITYGIATVGAFAVIGAVDRLGGGCQSITDLAGLHRRSPLLAACLLVFVLSLAGIPPLAGFLAKFQVFAAALKVGGLHAPPGWLALAGIAASVVGLYYYLLVLKQAWVAPAKGERFRVPPDLLVTLVFAAALLLILGLIPSLVHVA